ncbi:MAG TPA: 1-acyl-sn-glycerol-3-phosphate acyltransferase [Actinomycetes bacterium]|jgi:1-acyl-sn-glycerol-3-phosphate acyltransferase|nr:1-acyl-sn-glycerol-3-phosphate acyltransferase [Actinomycetes bacterium]
MLPPRILRRLVLAPLLPVITVALVVTLPLLLIAAAAASPSLPGRWRGLRLLWFCLVWLTLESVALMVCLALWVASGFGGRLRSEAYQERHYALMRWFLGTLFSVATRAFHLRVEIEEPELTAEEAAARLARPLIVLSRHGGPGDSFLLVHRLLSEYQRRPRIVLKAMLQLDPGLDVVLNRLPHAFVRPERSSAVTREIERLAGGLGGTGALVIFPEGGNYSPRRRQRAIERLEQRQRLEEAARARAMHHLLAPRTGGALTAIAAAPEADVIFVAHTGLEDLVTVGDIWRALPIEQTLKARWWRVPATEVPRGLPEEEQVRWLYDWWSRIDAWIDENRPVPLPPRIST